MMGIGPHSSCLLYLLLNHCTENVAQDSEPAHRTGETVQLLQQGTAEFVSPDPWLPCALDLNPVDYRIHGLMQERVYRSRARDSGDLKQLLGSASSSMHGVVDETVDQCQ